MVRLYTDNKSIYEYETVAVPSSNSQPTPWICQTEILRAESDVRILHLSGALEIDGECYTYSFIGNNKTVTAVYSIGDEMTYEYFTNKPVKVTDIMGKTKTVNPTDGKIELILTGNVQYITE